MYLLNYFEQKNLSLFDLNYDEWLPLPELPFFNLMSDQEEEYWVLLQQTPGLSSSLTLVSLVELDGIKYKLDGKIRKKLWQSGKLPIPENMIAQVFEINQEDLSVLSHANSIKRAQSLAPNEAIQSIYQELGLEFRSERIKSGFIYDAINIALRGRPRNLQDKRQSSEKEEIDMRKAIKLFSKELTLLDSLNPKPELFVTGVLAAALIMLGTHRDLHEFFKRVNSGQVEYKDGLEDPVAGLIRLVQRHRVDDQAMPANLAIDLCRKTIQSITLWEEGRDSPLYWRRKLVSGVDHLPYVRALKRAKHIDDQRDL
jgi:hypothetical protein